MRGKVRVSEWLKVVGARGANMLLFYTAWTLGFADGLQCRHSQTSLSLSHSLWKPVGVITSTILRAQLPLFMLFSYSCQKKKKPSHTFGTFYYNYFLLVDASFFVGSDSLRRIATLYIHSKWELHQGKENQVVSCFLFTTSFIYF